MKPHVFPPRAGGLPLPAKPVLTTLAFLCVLGWPAAPARATDRVWIGAVNQFWSVAGNWNPAGAPQNGDALYFGANDNPTNRSMINDLPGNLQVTRLSFASHNYSVNGANNGNAIEILTNGLIEILSGTCSVNSDLRLDGVCDCSADWFSVLYLNGAISGAGSLLKYGAGDVYLGGGANNTYAGDTTVTEGTLYVGSVPGNLNVGPPVAGYTATAAIFGSAQIGGPAVTVIGNGSVLNLNGYDLTLSELGLKDGGSVQTGSGALYLTSGATISVGSMYPQGAYTNSSLQGTIVLPPNSASAHFIVQPYATNAPADNGPELDVPATILVGYENPRYVPTGILKEGDGRMRLGGTNTYRGATSLAAGTLQVDGVQTNSYVLVNGGTLTGTGRAGGIYLNTPSATVAPGDDGNPGALECTAFGSSSGRGIFRVQLNGLGSYSRLLVDGAINLTGISLQGSVNYPPAYHDTFIVISNRTSAAITGTFNGVPDLDYAVIGNEFFQVDYYYYNGDYNANNNVAMSAVEPVFHPRLGIDRAGSNAVRVFWPVGNPVIDPSFALESATNLATTNWTSVSPPAPAIQVGTNYVVTNALDATKKFYRLTLLK